MIEHTPMLNFLRNLNDIQHQLWTLLMLLFLFFPVSLSMVMQRQGDAASLVQKVIDISLVPLGASAAAIGMILQAIALYSVQSSSVSSLGGRYITGLFFGAFISSLTAVRYFSLSFMMQRDLKKRIDNSSSYSAGSDRRD